MFAVTAYVTLEPCSFQGRTPSCAQLFVEHGVVIGVRGGRPSSRNRGLGLDKMRAGVEVIGPVMEKEAVDLNPGHFKKFTTGLPLVRLKIAASLDGKTALSNERVSGSLGRMLGVMSRAGEQRVVP